MDIKDFLELIEYKITGGDNYLWKCYGDNARSIERYVDKISIHCVFDTVNRTVYEATISDEITDRCYRWIHPEFKQAFIDECKARNVRVGQAWDDVDYVDLDVAWDFIEKAGAMLRGESFDERVVIEFDMPQDVLFKVMLAAHHKDVTLNQFLATSMEDALKDLGFEVPND